MPVPNRSRNKTGRWRKKRRDAHDYNEREKQRPLQASDQEPSGANSLSDQVVLKIQERIRDYRTMKRNRREDDG